jgi:hypothetical protein
LEACGNANITIRIVNQENGKTTWQGCHWFSLKVIKAPINEINSAGIGVSITPTSIKHGRKNTGYRFDCQSVPKTLPAKKRNEKHVEQAQPELPEIVAADADSHEDKWSSVSSRFAHSGGNQSGLGSGSGSLSHGRLKKPPTVTDRGKSVPEAPPEFPCPLPASQNPAPEDRSREKSGAS